jgi:hypothetical protein
MGVRHIRLKQEKLPRWSIYLRGSKLVVHIRRTHNELLVLNRSFK